MTEPTRLSGGVKITKSFGPCPRCIEKGYERVRTAPYTYFGSARMMSICPHCEAESKKARCEAKRHREHLESTFQIPKEGD